MGPDVMWNKFNRFEGMKHEKLRRCESSINVGKRLNIKQSTFSPGAEPED